MLADFLQAHNAFHHHFRHWHISMKLALCVVFQHLSLAWQLVYCYHQNNHCTRPIRKLLFRDVRKKCAINIISYHSVGDFIFFRYFTSSRFVRLVKPQVHFSGQKLMLICGECVRLWFAALTIFGCPCSFNIFLWLDLWRWRVSVK